MKSLVDEDLPRAVADLLKGRGHDAENSRDIGLGGKADREIIGAARERGAILWTADVGFGNIHAFPPGSHSGVVLLRFPDHFRRHDILALVRSFLDEADLTALVGALVVVSPGRYRVRR